MSFIIDVSTLVANQPTYIKNLKELDVLSTKEKEEVSLLGIKSISTLEEMTSYELAYTSSKNLLDKIQFQRKKIDYLIYISPKVPEKFICSSATRLAYDLKLDQATAFEMGGLGCVTISSALILADNLIRGQNISNVLISFGFSNILKNRYRRYVTLNGDAGCAVLISKNKGFLEILNHKTEVNGQYWNLFEIDYKNKNTLDWKETCSNRGLYSFQLALEGRDHFAKMIKTSFVEMGLSKKIVYKTLTQNLSQSAYEFYEKHLNLNVLDICSKNLKMYGHLGGVDIILNLDSIKNFSHLNEEIILVLNSSPVAAWSSIFLRKLF